MDVKTATDVGQVRENNEDALWVGPQCLVVCDGMGGHVAGEVAAELAVGVIRSFPFGEGEPQQEIAEAIAQAQARILEEASQNEEYQGMGSTITLAWVSPPRQDGQRELIVGHVGTAAATSMQMGSCSSLPMIILLWGKCSVLVPSLPLRLALTPNVIFSLKC